jgi:hypothetical protein
LGEFFDHVPTRTLDEERGDTDTNSDEGNFKDVVEAMSF